VGVRNWSKAIDTRNGATYGLPFCCEAAHGVRFPSHAVTTSSTLKARRISNRLCPFVSFRQRSPHTLRSNFLEFFIGQAFQPNEGVLRLARPDQLI
jgi:hypothetical protein